MGCGHREGEASESKRRLNAIQNAEIILRPARRAVTGVAEVTDVTTGKPTMFHHVRFRILDRDNFRCRYCGRSAQEDGVKLHVDHVIPLSLGGADNDDQNLVTSCGECNIGKGATLITSIVLGDACTAKLCSRCGRPYPKGGRAAYMRKWREGRKGDVSP